MPVLFARVGLQVGVEWAYLAGPLTPCSQIQQRLEETAPANAAVTP